MDNRQKVNFKFEDIRPTIIVNWKRCKKIPVIIWVIWALLNTSKRMLIEMTTKVIPRFKLIFLDEFSVLFFEIEKRYGKKCQPADRMDDSRTRCY
jgi:hypothetical protein